MKRLTLPLVLSLAFACGDDATPEPTDTATATDSGTGTTDVATDAAADDAIDVVPDVTEDVAPEVVLGDDVYFPKTPPSAAVPEVRRAARWVTHWTEDLAPYWTTAAALGSPVGNFPTYRGMNGDATPPTRRRPRMMARQIFAYSAGYLMTGDEALLANAEAGVTWLRDHAIDRTHGGCYPELAASGSAIDGVRTAQDHAYCMLGLAAFFYVTRDPAVEADLLAGRDQLFDPALFWDATNGRVRDALDATMTTEVDVENDGDWELVAQLDPINAFLLLVQPVLTDPADRALVLEDLRRLGQVIVDHFYQDDWFWGVSNKKGAWTTKHVDFGHCMKSVWMLRAIDQRLPDHPFHELVERVSRALVARAWDADNGRWAKRPLSSSTVEYGSDWWQYAEADQLTATLDLADGTFDARLSDSQSHWLTDYVDTKYPVREVIPSVRRDGSPAYGWGANDTAKCNEWKNGYHSAEHALVLSIVGSWREGIDTTLHFAVPDAAAASFEATPYIFHGREVGREPGALVGASGSERREVVVRFRDLW